MLVRSTTIFIIAAVSVVVVLLLSIVQPAIADDFVELPHDLEIELALSALPEELQDGATIYVRGTKKGFVLYREGTNGFTTFVARTSVRFYDADWPYTYPSDQLIPVAFDRVGAQHHMQPYFDIERLRVEGVPPERAKTIQRTRNLESNKTAPPQVGHSYMFQTLHRAYGAPAQSDEKITVSFPHYMPFAPYVITEHLGPMDPDGRVGSLDHGGPNAGPHGYLYFMVPQDQVSEIRTKYADMLDQLCQLHANWCLPDM